MKKIISMLIIVTVFLGIAYGESSEIIEESLDADWDLGVSYRYGWDVLSIEAPEKDQVYVRLTDDLVEIKTVEEFEGETLAEYFVLQAYRENIDSAFVALLRAHDVADVYYMTAAGEWKQAGSDRELHYLFKLFYDEFGF